MSTLVAPYRLSLPFVRVLLADLGVRPADLLDAAGLPGDLLNGEEAVLPARQYYAVFETLDQLVGDRDLAVAIADKLSPEVFDPPIFAAMCSANLHVASERIAVHKRLLGPLRLYVTPDADGVNLEITWPAGHPPPAVLPVVEAAFWVALARIGTRTRVVPQRVVLPQMPRNVAAVEDWLCARVERGDTTLIRFSRLDATRPFLTANAGMWDFFEPELRRRLDDLAGDATLGAKVRATLVELLPAGTGSTLGVASHLGISTRTLQRRLGGEGVTFQELLAEVREGLARHYLTQSALSLTEIAFLLGYDDPNSFHRAFNRWTGRTPLGVRETAAG
ncbi:AraC family transcriptional regulator [Mycolicibacterium arenosum]|uniref:AraC family transcriptional regulator n=1 Tax=Mycolicibacterium arenosum TaxID=2952157 RepID=A0ABT1M0X3_9MYCO|nr:AraC family transcriptional regulator [Mycolicibacterium sp. CAU 1645]MCP9272525.1 AraC family transcriptional regulator [Mycolicibacterium sp. CAU 1645]